MRVVLTTVVIGFIYTSTVWAQDNILLIIADDVGVEKVAVYGEAPDAGPTPNIDALAHEGILFANAWSYPTCSPTRATILTGLYGFRTGIGKFISQANPFGLDATTLTIPDVLGAIYASSAVGKWHLGSKYLGVLDATHPNQSGFSYYAGALDNLTHESYFAWSKVVNGSEPFFSTTYATTDTVNDALAQISSASEPWFVWLAFNAPHIPLHAPPSELHSQALFGDPHDYPVEYYRAMTEAMDTEIGRLIAGIPQGALNRTTIIFVGDNGTPGRSTHLLNAKGTLYEGGINVPLIIKSPYVAVPGSVSNALVSTTDIFATITDIANVSAGLVDAVSMLPYLLNPSLPSQRSFVFSEQFEPNGFGPFTEKGEAVRDSRYKLLRQNCEVAAFFDLTADPLEENNLLPYTAMTNEEQNAFNVLYTNLVATVGPDCDMDTVADINDNCLFDQNPLQEDADSDGYGNSCDADYDNNGTIGSNDFNTLRVAFGSLRGDVAWNPVVDHDSNGVIGVSDFNTFRMLFMRNTPGPSGLSCAGSIPCP